MNKIVYIVIVSFSYEGGWIVGVYDKESIAKRIRTNQLKNYRAENLSIIPCIMNKQLKSNDKYI